MVARKSETALTAAIAAARDFKQLLDIQAPDSLFFPRHKGDARTTAIYRAASGRLEKAVSQALEGAKGPDVERCLVLPIADVVANQGTAVPPNQFQQFAQIVTAIAQLGLQVLDECGDSAKHGGFLEIGIRFRGQVEEVGKPVEGEGNAVHESDSDVVVEHALCHGATNAGEVR